MAQWETYQDILLEEYSKRKSLDPEFSQRRFADSLNIAPSRLSEILRQQQGLSEKWGQQIAVSLNFDSTKTKIFLGLIAKQSARNEAARKIAEIQLAQYRQQYVELREDAFEVLKNWYHFPILEKLRCDGVDSIESIAQSLGIPLQTVIESIERMKRLEMIQVSPDGSVLASGNFRMQPEKSSEALKTAHTALIEMSLQSLKHHPSEAREFGMNILSMSPDQLPEAKAYIRQFLARFGEKFSDRKKGNKVYSLLIQFFSLENTQPPQKPHPTFTEDV